MKLNPRCRLCRFFVRRRCVATEIRQCPLQTPRLALKCLKDMLQEHADLDPCCQLCASIVVSAAQDLCEKQGTHVNSTDKRSAAEFLSDDVHGVATCAALAGLDPRFVRTAVQRFLDALKRLETTKG